MKAFLFVPAPEAGHILPFLPVIKRLHDDGHTATILVSEAYAGMLRSRGFDAETYSGESPLWGCDELYKIKTPGRWLWAREWARSLGRDHIWESFETRLLHLRRAGQYDCLVVDTLIAQSAHLYCSGSWRNGLRVVEMSTSLKVRSRQAGEPCDPTIVLCPPIILPDDFPDASHEIFFAEPSIYIDDKVASTPKYELRPSIVCCFGSQSSASKVMSCRLDALLTTAESMPDLDFFIATGGQWTSIRQIPRNVFLRETISQQFMLRRAELLLTHGGLGSIKEAIVAGVPLLCWPLRGDQYFNARCVENKGLGRTLASKAQAPAIVAAIAALRENTDFFLRTQRFQMVFKAEEAEPTAAKLLLRFASLARPSIDAGD